ncbi:MAG: zinc ribbon domain-containing protein [bacterium]|nr:zinc ribbon domain-containing protein [bacterium]
MPIYEYQCNTCGSTCEILHRTLKEKAVVCPDCQSTELTRLISAPGAVMTKGSVSQGMPPGCPNQASCGVPACPHAGHH